jgi:hypothetical protein
MASRFYLQLSGYRCRVLPPELGTHGEDNAIRASFAHNA